MGKSKRMMLWAAALLLCLLVFAGVTLSSGKTGENKPVKIGVSVYRANDTFIASIVSELEEKVKEKEQQENITIKLDISDGKESQAEQNEQVERYISLGYDVICVNLVDRTSASMLIDKAETAGIPLIFFNREPVEEDIFSGDHIYYIGSDARKSAVIQGEIILEAYRDNPALLDANGDGIVEYAMLEGEAGHQDTIIRTEESVKTLEAGGMKLKKVCGFVANFDRSQAAALVEQWLEANPNIPVELFISNNDDMALGAAESLRKDGKVGIPIVGIDGTPLGVEAVETGELLGTVVSNASLYAENIFRLAYACGEGTPLPDNLQIVNERYIWIPWESCTNSQNDGKK